MTDGPGPCGAALRRMVAESIAREAGLLALRLQRDPDLVVELKGIQDFVSAADRALEDLIKARIAAAFPEDAVLGEESGASAGIDEATAVWVIDPIDGTANFVRGRAGWCVSIALVRDGRAEIGVIYDPVQDELFSARHGHGATRNGEPIRVSRRTSLEGAMIGNGFSYRRPVADHVRISHLLLEAGCEYRRSGTGALDMAHVADGRLDGYVEMHINAWDVLAGLVLVREAGGWTNDFLRDGGLSRGNPILAAPAGLAEAVCGLLGLDLS
ncbi:inositol monophosphatase family protein [Arenibaculum pallidiluteum]|uniref:inositol monophosphatase family protein n=1 Tax=Arenibaculum pallidiluteum TaxID=2812559 RepID=UPI001A9772CB|nr:inositol monophosphatase family protein [Arenibaculum pallidiluteum]